MQSSSRKSQNAAGLQLIRKPSLAALTVAALRQQIQSGAWAGALPGERQLCDQLEISRPTLRAALTQLEREGWITCSQGRRRQVTTERPTASRPSAEHTVLLLTPLPLHAVPPQMLFVMDHLREHLGEAGYDLQVLQDRRCYSNSPARALEEVVGRLRPAGGVLFMSTAPMQRWFSARGLPCVITGLRHANVSLACVGTDYRAVCRHAAGLLLAKGHRRLVLLNPAGDQAGEVESEQGFREALRQNGLPEKEIAIVRHDGTREGLCQRIDGLLQRGPRPTAFLVSRSIHVLATMGQLTRRGIRLPQDASLISRDDNSYLEHVVPTVARYVLDPAKYARVVTRTVLRQLRGATAETPDHRVIPGFTTGETLGVAPEVA